MPEKEYIEREALNNLLHQDDFYTPDERWRPESEFATLIDAIPAADVAEVKHGKWLYVSGVGRCAEYECSECKAHVCFDEKIDGTIPVYNGCPHCLAKMDGKEKKDA